MCVIMLVTAEDKRPNDTMIEKAWLQNPDGGGIAWWEKNKQGKAVVRWEKGLDEGSWGDLVRTVPTPYVAHARIASAEGGQICEELTHPFPVDEHVSLALKGTTTRGVLFHNGNWKEWAGEGRLALYNAKGAQMPAGRMNDTRTMAWLTHLFGDNFMEFLPSQRGIMFRPTSWEIFAGPGWKEINGVWCSNDLFIHRQKSQGYQGPAQPQTSGTISGTQTFCRVASCNRRDLDPTGYCGLHTLPEPGAHGTGPKALEPAVILAPDGQVVGTSGVSPASPNPFRAAASAIILNRALTEEWFKKEWMSKNLYKQISLAHEWVAESREGKKHDKGIKILNALINSPHLHERMRVE